MSIVRLPAAVSPTFDVAEAFAIGISPSWQPPPANAPIIIALTGRHVSSLADAHQIKPSMAR